MKVLILGGGYSGILTAKALEKNIKSISITLIDKNPYHTLMTELHEIAGGRVRAGAVKIPYGMVFKKKSAVKVVQDEIKNFDLQNNKISSDNNSYEYDYLVIATGSRPEFYGVEGVERYGYKMWSYREAIAIRSLIYDHFQIASGIGSPTKRRKYLTFVVAGGGFTGVELAGEIASWKKRLCKQFGIERSEPSVYLLEAAPDILTAIGPRFSQVAKKYLKKLNVDVLTGSAVEKMEGDQIFLTNGDVIDGTLIWTAGIKGNPYIEKSDINLEHDFINVNEHLQSLSCENVFSVGDALYYIYNERPIPKVIETCKQSADLAAKNILLHKNQKALASFRPKYHGSIASIGPYYGVAKVGNMKVKWLFATALKHVINLRYLIGIGGFKLCYKYLDDQFINRFMNLIKGKEAI